MNAIERHRELVARAVYEKRNRIAVNRMNTENSLRLSGLPDDTRRFLMDDVDSLQRDENALSEVIAELERESTRAGGTP